MDEINLDKKNILSIDFSEEIIDEVIEEPKEKTLEEVIEEKIEEKVSEKISQIPIPKDGETPTDDKLIELIEPRIPKVKDGKTPTKTEIKAIVKQVIPTAKEIAEIVLPKIPKPKDGEDGKSFRFADLTAYEKQILTGPQGSNGVGVPRGGATGQKLVKTSSKDFDTEWTNDSGGTPTLQQVTDEGNSTTNDIIVPDEAYGAGWNGSMEVPTKNAIYDKIQTITESDTLQTVTDRGSTTTNAITSSRTTTTSPVDGFVASTSSTATSGNQKSSATVKWTGSGWKSSGPTSARQIDWRAWVLPEQAASNEPTAIWKLQSQVNNGGWTDHFWIDNKVGGLGAYFNSTGSNGSPGTTRAITINNTGSYSWIDWTFSGIRKVADGANSSGGRDFYASGGSYFSYIDGNSNSLFSYSYPSGLYHVGGGWFGGRVSAGQGSNPTSTLTSLGSFATKGRRVTSNYTLTDLDSVIYADASTATCSGTPTYSCSHWTNQTDCEKWDAHGGCSWYAGSSCSEWNGNQSECDGHSGCTYETASCSGIGDEPTCSGTSGCSWSGTDCSPLNESECGTYSGSGCTVNTSDCSTFNGNESGCSGQSGCSVSSSNTCPSQGDESSCTGAGCTWDGMSCTGDNSTCTGSYFTGCTGTYYTCTGTYYTGNCSGTYGAACQGTPSCSGIDDSTNCGFETGCTWATAITLTFPNVISTPDRHVWTYNDSSTGADVVHVASGGSTMDKSSSFTATTYKEALHWHAFSESVSCSGFNEGQCTPSGCSKNYTNCSWNSGDNTCSGDASCTGIGDQTTCESTTYYSGCTGSYYSVKNWYLLSRS